MLSLLCLHFEKYVNKKWNIRKTIPIFLLVNQFQMSCNYVFLFHKPPFFFIVNFSIFLYKSFVERPLLVRAFNNCFIWIAFVMRRFLSVLVMSERRDPNNCFFVRETFIYVWVVCFCFLTRVGLVKDYFRKIQAHGNSQK